MEVEKYLSFLTYSASYKRRGDGEIGADDGEIGAGRQDKAMGVHTPGRAGGD